MNLAIVRNKLLECERGFFFVPTNSVEIMNNR